MAKKINLVLICGGKSTEHEISIISAGSIYQALDKTRYNVIPVGITKTGTWVKGESVVKALVAGGKITEPAEKTSILPDPTAKHLAAFSADRLVVKGSQAEEINVVFPVLHGPLGEDGTIQGLLEMANVAYVGSGVLGSALGMDKVKQKQVWQQYGLPLVNYYWFKKLDWERGREKVLSAITKQFKNFYPLFIKPANNGSSVGITKAHNFEELKTGIKVALNYDAKILVEQGVDRAREIEVAVLGNDEPEVSVCGEIFPSREFYDYAAKYNDGTSGLKIPAELKPAMAKKIQAIARQAFLAVDGAGLARVDFLLSRTSHDFYLNEINTMPGFTKISMYPKLWEHSGLPYTKLVDKLIQLAVERWEAKQQIQTSK